MLVDRVPSMPERTFWFWNGARAHPALLTRAPTLDIAMFERAARQLPRALREAIRRGVLAAEADSTPTQAQAASGGASATTERQAPPAAETFAQTRATTEPETEHAVNADLAASSVTEDRAPPLTAPMPPVRALRRRVRLG